MSEGSSSMDFSHENAAVTMDPASVKRQSVNVELPEVSPKQTQQNREKSGRRHDKIGESGDSSVEDDKSRLQWWSKLDFLVVFPRGPSPFGVLLTLLIPLALGGYALFMFLDTQHDILQTTSLKPTQREMHNITIRCVDALRVTKTGANIGGASGTNSPQNNPAVDLMIAVFKESGKVSCSSCKTQGTAVISQLGIEGFEQCCTEGKCTGPGLDYCNNVNIKGNLQASSDEEQLARCSELGFTKDVCNAGIAECREKKIRGKECLKQLALGGGTTRSGGTKSGGTKSAPSGDGTTQQQPGGDGTKPQQPGGGMTKPSGDGTTQQQPGGVRGGDGTTKTGGGGTTPSSGDGTTTKEKRLEALEIPPDGWKQDQANKYCKIQIIYGQGICGYEYDNTDPNNQQIIERKAVNKTYYLDSTSRKNSELTATLCSVPNFDSEVDFDAPTYEQGGIYISGYMQRVKPIILGEFSLQQIPYGRKVADMVTDSTGFSVKEKGPKGGYSMDDVDNMIERETTVEGGKTVESKLGSRLTDIQRAFNPGEFEVARQANKMSVTRVAKITIRDVKTKSELGYPNVTMSIWTAGSQNVYGSQNSYGAELSQNKETDATELKQSLRWKVVLMPDHLFTTIEIKMRFDLLIFIAQVGGIFGIIAGGLQAIKSATLFIGERRCKWCCNDRLKKQQLLVLEHISHLRRVGASKKPPQGPGSGKLHSV